MRITISLSNLHDSLDMALLNLNSKRRPLYIIDNSKTLAVLLSLTEFKTTESLKGRIEDLEDILVAYDRASEDSVPYSSYRQSRMSNITT
jgi:PHD/YefM family antitoxin component YafN of YafNO toxin-antitoxin module